MYDDDNLKNWGEDYFKAHALLFKLNRDMAKEDNSIVEFDSKQIQQTLSDYFQASDLQRIAMSAARQNPRGVSHE